jgi:hypothetical protein
LRRRPWRKTRSVGLGADRVGTTFADESPAEIREVKGSGSKFLEPLEAKLFKQDHEATLLLPKSAIIKPTG